jgi:hypothetical protein
MKNRLCMSQTPNEFSEPSQLPLRTIALTANPDRRRGALNLARNPFAHPLANAPAHRPPARHLLAALTFLIHFTSSLWGSHLGYGFFRDELYFLVCGHHLAWGYVDQPPLVALQARLAESLFGLSPTGIRILSFLAGGVTVGLTGLLTWQFGGRRIAQILP